MTELNLKKAPFNYEILEEKNLAIKTHTTLSTTTFLKTNIGVFTRVLCF